MMLNVVRSAAVLVAVLLSGGCADSSANRQPDTLRIRLKKDPATLDPARIVDLDGARIAAKLYNTLVTFGDDLTVVPDLAASWTVSADRRTYTFFLRRGVRFHNGRELTAEDVRYSFERVLRPATRSPRTWVLSRIAGARPFMEGRAERLAGLRAGGPYEIVIELDEPFAPFLSLLGLTTASIIARDTGEALTGDGGFHPCGTGPFAFKQWRHNQWLQLERHEAFFCGRPAVTNIRYEIVPEDFTALVAFEKGDLDLVPEIMAADYDRLARDPRRRECFLRQPELNTYYIGLNCRRAPFTDARVRRAMHHAIDKHRILATVLGGRGVPAVGPLPPALRGTGGRERYPYDPDRARALLRAAGYPDGFSMTLYQAADAESLDILQAIQAYLTAVGIRVQLRQLEWSAFLDTVSSGEAQAFWLSWWADYPDAENFLFPLFHSSTVGSGGNRCRFSDAAVDAALSGALQIDDPERRRAAYRALEQDIVTLSPMVWCWHKSVTGIRQPWVEQVRIPALPVMEKFTAVRIGCRHEGRTPREGVPGG